MFSMFSVSFVNVRLQAEEEKRKAEKAARVTDLDNPRSCPQDLSARSIARSRFSMGFPWCSSIFHVFSYCFWYRHPVTWCRNMWRPGPQNSWPGWPMWHRPIKERVKKCRQRLRTFHQAFSSGEDMAIAGDVPTMLQLQLLLVVLVVVVVRCCWLW